jgi:hypothetical protein
LVYGSDIVHNVGHPSPLVAFLLHRREADVVGPRAVKAATSADALAPKPRHPPHPIDEADPALAALGLRLRPSGGLWPPDHLGQNHAQAAQRLGLQVRNALRLEQRLEAGEQRSHDLAQGEFSLVVKHEDCQYTRHHKPLNEDLLRPLPPLCESAPFPRYEKTRTLVPFREFGYVLFCDTRKLPPFVFLFLFDHYSSFFSLCRHRTELLNDS